ncbi:MAG: hypothetical protein COA73_03455 [Candidatus Hydrogenedentota bacterium]|nr:MAG: hypothetical protein COA73_03455 [Candidatus Hydrogenedentota bacterium]
MGMGVLNYYFCIDSVKKKLYVLHNLKSERNCTLTHFFFLNVCVKINIDLDGRVYMRFYKKLYKPGNTLCTTVCFSFLLTTFLLLSPTAYAQDSDVVFDKVKAALIFKFTSFVKWPDEAFDKDNSPLKICIVENKTIYNELKKAVKKMKPSSHPVEVFYKTWDEDFESCHIIFLDESISRKFYNRFEELHKLSMLTIGDDEKFAREGGIIRISENNNRPDLEVNIDSAKDSNLVISSQVLKLSKVIRNKEE